MDSRLLAPDLSSTVFVVRVPVQRRVRGLWWPVVVQVQVCVVLSFVLRLGTGTARQNLVARRRKKGRAREKRGEKDAAEKKSEDQLVARIGFRTVSNDTGQDTTATIVLGNPPAIADTPAFFVPRPARTVQEAHGGRRSRGNGSRTVSRSSSAELHGSFFVPSLRALFLSATRVVEDRENRESYHRNFTN